MCALRLKSNVSIIFMFLAKLFEIRKLSDGWSIWLSNHVNYVTPHFQSKNNVNKVVKVVPEYSN